MIDLTDYQPETPTQRSRREVLAALPIYWGQARITPERDGRFDFASSSPLLAECWATESDLVAIAKSGHWVHFGSPTWLPWRGMVRMHQDSPLRLAATAWDWHRAWVRGDHDIAFPLADGALLELAEHHIEVIAATVLQARAIKKYLATQVPVPDLPRILVADAPHP